MKFPTMGATMCGIIGYVGKRQAPDIILEGLRRLEYRGYDSAGISLLKDDGELETIKQAGRVMELTKEVLLRSAEGTQGIGHTRWATHGGVTQDNAHPHLSMDRSISLVHNGVIENYLHLKKFLMRKGYEFYSQTDSEILANLIAYHYKNLELGAKKNRLVESVRVALSEVEGTYGIVVLSANHPGELVAARKSSPLILGVGKDENIIASDVAALTGHTSNVVYLSDGQIAHVKSDTFSIINHDHEKIIPTINKVNWIVENSELGDFATYMEKEIFEQPLALENAMRGRFSEDGSTTKFGGLNMTPRDLRQIDRIILIGCGTAWHACLVGEYMIEKYARIPVEVEYASEFRYKNAPIDKNTLVFAVSQSGETIDTLEAVREAKRKGYRVMAITNTVGSTIAREVDGGIYQHAGPEIGVASTKAFTSQAMILSMLAVYLGRMRDIGVGEGMEMVKAIKELPKLVQKFLRKNEQIRLLSENFAQYEDFLFLGRQELFPIALEGALKLKEISYVHAEGFAAGEMKHGVIALVSEKCPTVVLVQKGEVAKKVVSNLQEVAARGGPTIVVAEEGVSVPEGVASEVIRFPSAHPLVAPILATVPLQILANSIASALGRDVDKPRNLAKSVTVE